MFRFVKHNFMKFASPVDPRTVALFLACALAFYMGMRFEMVDTAKVQKKFDDYKLAQAEDLIKVQQAALDKQRAMQAKMKEIQDASSKREAQRIADYNRLRVRLAAERVRSKASAKSVPKVHAPDAAGNCPSTAAEGNLWEPAGESIISLMDEADKYLDGFRDCQAYVRSIQEGLGQ